MAKLYRLAIYAIVVLCVVHIVYSEEKKKDTDDDGVVVEEDKTDSREGKALSKTTNKNGWLALTRGIMDNFRSSSPVFLVVSVALGAILRSFLLDSPLSPFPVPPLPGPPTGRFPPYQQAIPVPIISSNYPKVKLPSSYPAYHLNKYTHGRSMDLQDVPTDSPTESGGFPTGGENNPPEDVRQRENFDSSKFKDMMDSYESKNKENGQEQDAEKAPSVEKDNKVSEAWTLAIRTLNEFFVNLQKRTALYAETSKSSNKCADKSDCNKLDNKETMTETLE